MTNAYHAAPWSNQSLNDRDRRSHHQRTRQRGQEEQGSWAREKREWRTSWTWEEIMAGDKTLTWKQAEAAKKDQRRLRGSQPRRKHERQLSPQTIGLGHTEWFAEPRGEPAPVWELSEALDERFRREVWALRALQSGRAEERDTSPVSYAPVSHIWRPVRLLSSVCPVYPP